jgi:Holliday junction resolvasome RuvABC endonuclease subunit
LILQVVGFDPSLRNWGVAKGTYDTERKELNILEVDVICTKAIVDESVRKSRLDLESGAYLAKHTWVAAEGAQVVFVEVPHGSQSARAMCSYGICIGVLSSFAVHNKPFISLSAREVKLITGKAGDATKEQMISWAMLKHPEANWPLRMQQGEERVIVGKAEHMADAVATIHAGLETPSFKEYLDHYITK